uniref:Transport permease protein n=1 Tax=Streptomyces sp. K01-0509 TaxID=1238679 RepID=K4JEX4_9ACTN|nr:ABC type multidrug transport system, permease component [Streptomyces sp. K01-0509]
MTPDASAAPAAPAPSGPTAGRIAAQARHGGGPLLRILPAGSYSGLAHRLVERTALVYSRAWLVLVSGVFEPLFYLLAFQVGFSSLIDGVTGPDGRPMTYVAFVAPALLVSSAMNGAVYETLSIFYKLRFDRLYDMMLATPMGALDVAIGEISWAVLRSGLYATAFLGVMAAMGLATSPWALMLIPTALLIATAFAALGMVCATLLRSSSQFDYIHVVVMPMFLFSTTFYPMSVSPPVLRFLVELSPLYHGIELARGFSVGALDPSMIGHACYLAALAAVGLYGASRRIGKLLLS